MSASKIGAYKDGYIVHVVAKKKIPVGANRITLLQAEEYLGKQEFRRRSQTARLVASFLSGETK